ncbi:MAG: hypothetical protein QXO66_05785, partial [Thermofilum sp.]
EQNLQEVIEKNVASVREHFDKRASEILSKSEENYEKLEEIEKKSSEELQMLIHHHQWYEEVRVSGRESEIVSLLYAILKRLDQLETRLELISAEMEKWVITR